MTERGRRRLAYDSDGVTIAGSSVRWAGDHLHIDVDEFTAPIPSRLRGVVRVHPHFLAHDSYALDAAARHHWRPIAPRARVEARFDDGATHWRGEGYWDMNWGDEPLESAFRYWDWSRAHAPQRTIVDYDATTREGEVRRIGLAFDATGRTAYPAPPEPTRIEGALWRMPRRPRAHGDLRLVRTLEDAPFYTRSLLAGAIDGESADIMHESLSLDRIRHPVVRAMLPFRMPRIA